jgi:hypothetical protein
MDPTDLILFRSKLHYLRGYVVSSTDTPWGEKLIEIVEKLVELYDELYEKEVNGEHTHSPTT